MGRKKAQILSRDAFVKAWVEAEILMRNNLAARIDVEIEKETNPDIVNGLVKAREIIAGRTEQ